MYARCTPCQICSTVSSSSFSTCKRSNFLRVSENWFLVSSSCNLTVLNLLLFGVFLILCLFNFSLSFVLTNDGHLLRRLRALLLCLSLEFCVAVISIYGQSGSVLIHLVTSKFACARCSEEIWFLLLQGC